MPGSGGSGRGDPGTHQKVELITLPEGESGVLQGNITEDRLDVLSSYWGRPACERSRFSISQIAAASGLSVARFRASQRDKRVLARIRERFESEIIYDSIEARAIMRGIMLDESNSADSRLRAGRTILELAGDLKKGGGVNVVQNTLTPVTVVDEDDETFAMRVDQVLRERGLDREGG